MAKVADVKLKWTPSPSEDVVGQKVTVTIDGNLALESELSPEVSEVVIEVKASKSVVFSVLTIDAEGNETASEAYTFRVGDLVAPLAATDLGHEILAVRDVEDPVEE